MATATQGPPSQQSASGAEEEIALVIGLILAGRIPAPEPAASIAYLLGKLPDLDVASLDADVSARVSRLVVQVVPTPTGRGEAEIRASRTNLSFRAHYAIEAVKRVAGRVASGESIGDAFSGEKRHFRAHLDANAARVAGAALNDAAAARFGPVLSWRHAGKTQTHRPSHVAANGANYRVDAPPAATDGMLPGMAPHCECVPGPPIQGARLLT